MRRIRTCNGCGAVGEEGVVFNRNAGNVCKVCRAPRVRAYQQRIREERTPVYLRIVENLRVVGAVRDYGITTAQARALYEILICQICGGGPGDGKSTLSIDHCHEGGGVRGVICNPCNRALGYFDHDPNRLRAAATYLKRSMQGDPVA